MSHSSRTGPRAGPVLFLALWLGMAPPLGMPAGAQPRRPRVADAILGVRVGSSLADARRAIASVDPRAVNGESGGEEIEQDRDEPPGARKEMWSFRGTRFRWLLLKVDSRDRVVWVTASLRPSREIPFGRLGDLTIAARSTNSQAIWNVRRAAGNYRLVSRGLKGKATVVSLISLALPPVE